MKANLHRRAGGSRPNRPQIAGLAAGCISSLALCAAAGAQNAAAQAQPSSADAADDGVLKEVTVTGTRIRGVAPVGSALIQVGQAEIQESGQTTMTDILRQIPQVLNLGVSSSVYSGGATSQGASINGTLANSVNLRGLGPSATLTLVNGHRAPYGSLLAGSFDVDNLPGVALERIEVVPDGASATYGSDAIAGVVNLILRQPFDGAETSARFGGAAGFREWSASQVLGKTWSGSGLFSDGGIMLAYEHLDRDALPASARSALYNDNLAPYGGSNSSLAANVGNVLIDGQAYAIPKGQNGQSLTLANLGTAGQVNTQSRWLGADALPGTKRNSVALNFKQKVGSLVELGLDGHYSKRDLLFRDLSQGSGDAGYTVPATNPFSPCNPAKNMSNAQGIVCPADGTIQTTFNFLGAYGDSVVRTGFATNWEVNPSVAVDLPGGWKATLTQSLGEDSERTTDLNYPNVGSVAAALADPDPTTALNVFCDPAVATCNSAAVLGSVTGAYDYRTLYHLRTTALSLDGVLFSLPGGEARLAVGAEYSSERLRNGIVDYGALFGPPGTTLDTTIVTQRNSKGAYGELFVPLVGAANAVTGVQELHLSLALRKQKYSDVGSTTDPKFGLNWRPVAGVTAHASYGTSFRAPTLVDVNPASQAAIFPVDFADAQVGLGGAGTHSVVYQVGGNPSLKPEEATTWSLGVDLAPPQMADFSSSLNYYHINYKNQIGTPGYDAGPAAISAGGPGAYDSFVIYNPTLYPGKGTLTAAQFAALLQTVSSSTAPPYYGPPNPDPTTVAAIVDGRRANTGVVKTDGLDFTARYDWDSNWGRWAAGVSATYVLSYETAPVPDTELTDQVNRLLYPLRLRVRPQLTWRHAGWSVATFVNYSNRYRVDPSHLPAGAADRYQQVASYTTTDVTAMYDVGSVSSLNALSGVAVTLSAQNVFDRRPPFVLNAGGIAPILYDPQNASAVGRMVSCQITKKW